MTNSLTKNEITSSIVRKDGVIGKLITGLLSAKQLIVEGSLEVLGNAKFAGELTAKVIKAENIDALEARLLSLEANLAQGGNLEARESSSSAALSMGQDGQLLVKVGENRAVVSFDASDSASLNVDKIKAAEIEGLDQLIADKVKQAIDLAALAIQTQTAQLSKIQSENNGLAWIMTSSQAALVDQDGNPVTLFDNAGNATFQGKITAKEASFATLSAQTIKAKHIEGLDILVDQIFTNSLSSKDSYLGASDSAVLAETDFSSNGAKMLENVTFAKNAKVNLDLNVLGAMTASGGLVVIGPAEFKDKTLFDSLAEFMGDVLLRGNITFFGQPTFNKDTAGLALIKQGQKFVDVQFSSEYQYQPVVSATLTTPDLTSDQIAQLVTDKVCEAEDGQEVCQGKLMSQIWQSNLKYLVEQGNKKGFRIVLEQNAPFTLTFAWQALAIKDGVITTSEAPTNLSMPFEGQHKITEAFGVQADDPEINAQYHQEGLKGHDGLDFGMDIGTSILAVDDGEVSEIPKGVESYGLTVVIKHSWGKSYYGHLNEILVKPGDKVTKGQKIALSGNSGLSTAPHLHFGLSLNNTSSENGYLGKVDPVDYLPISSKKFSILPIHETSASGIWASH